MDGMTAIESTNLSKRFGHTLAASAVNLRLEAGSFTALLGPSGCGKTTLLRLIAGFEQPDAGTLHFGNRLVADANFMLPPEKRGLGIVFQSYALWPHMDVAGNVAYPLRAQGCGRAEIDARVQQALAMVSLTGYEARSVDALSGGQRQRVALARCLVTGTDIILLDEPLANLDVHLRAEMQDVFARLHEQTGATIVFVTHDQSEALALADSITVLDHGAVQQSGSPEDLYRHPANAMVASFIGKGSLVSARVKDGQIFIGDVTVNARGQIGGDKAMLLLRPHNLALAEAGIAARIGTARYIGTGYESTLTLSGGESVSLVTRERLEPGRSVHLSVHEAWIVPG